MSKANDTVWEEYYSVVCPHVRSGMGTQARTAYAEVLDMYWEPHRVYHSIEHLAAVLTELNKWKWYLNERDYLTAFVALLLHDVVYNVPAAERSNEDLSATWVAWFIKECSISNQAIDQAEAERAIRITEGHQPDSLISLIVCWCDLAGFTKGTAASREYSEQIRQEYLKVYTPEEYEVGRRAFLTSYRDPFKLYPGASRYLRLRAWWKNRKANQQLDRELAELDA